MARFYPALAVQCNRFFEDKIFENKKAYLSVKVRFRACRFRGYDCQKSFSISICVSNEAGSRELSDCLIILQNAEEFP